MGLLSFFNKEKKEDLNRGLEKTKENFFARLSRTIIGKNTVDDDVLDALEEALVTSDVGVETTLKIIERINARVAKDKYLGTDELHKILQEEIIALLAKPNNEDVEPFALPA
ncbi:MAG: signal recognition particle receptor subunit alpha, partial [Bacteroidales bacterium]|nr:signal recognition particle receptor subunit alpha [Bacteroidales bacterium]